DFVGIVLDPARPGIVLRQLGVAAAMDVELLVDHQAGGARRPLVDRQDHACESTNASVRRQASSDASANSDCLRSKKLCGAPSYVTISCSMPASESARSNSALSSAVMFRSAPAWSARIAHPISSMRSIGPGEPSRPVPG